MILEVAGVARKDRDIDSQSFNVSILSALFHSDNARQIDRLSDDGTIFD